MCGRLAILLLLRTFAGPHAGIHPHVSIPTILSASICRMWAHTSASICNTAAAFCNAMYTRSCCQGRSSRRCSLSARLGCCSRIGCSVRHDCRSWACRLAACDHQQLLKRVAELMFADIVLLRVQKELAQALHREWRMLPETVKGVDVPLHIHRLLAKDRRQRQRRGAYCVAFRALWEGGQCIAQKRQDDRLDATPLVSGCAHEGAVCVSRRVADQSLV